MNATIALSGLIVFAVHASGPLLLLAGVCYANSQLSIAGAAAWVVSAIYQVAYVVDKRSNR